MWSSISCSWIIWKNILSQICSRSITEDLNPHCSMSLYATCSWSSVHFKYDPGTYLTYKILADYYWSRTIWSMSSWSSISNQSLPFIPRIHTDMEEMYLHTTTLYHYLLSLVPKADTVKCHCQLYLLGVSV